MNEPPVTNQRKQNSRSGYSLSSLFLLLVLFALVSAHISPLLNAPTEEIHPETVWGLTLICGAAGTALGMIVGLCHYRRLRGMLLGLVLGTTFGALSGPAAAVSMAYPQHTLLTSFGSALVLLGLAAFFRRANDNDPVSRKDVLGASPRANDRE